MRPHPSVHGPHAGGAGGGQHGVRGGAVAPADPPDGEPRGQRLPRRPRRGVRLPRRGAGKPAPSRRSGGSIFHRGGRQPSRTPSPISTRIRCFHKPSQRSQKNTTVTQFRSLGVYYQDTSLFFISVESLPFSIAIHRVHITRNPLLSRLFVSCVPRSHGSSTLRTSWRWPPGAGTPSATAPVRAPLQGPRAPGPAGGKPVKNLWSPSTQPLSDLLTLWG